MNRTTAHLVGHDVDTDQIIAARHLVTTDPKELAPHLLEGTYPDLVSKIQPGDVLVGGRNFGCGSSREHAPLAILGAGIPCVIAASFARIFFRNAINVGLAPLEIPEAHEVLADGSTIEIDLAAGAVRQVETGRCFQAKPLPPFVREILAAGGLIPYIAQSRTFAPQAPGAQEVCS